MATLICLLVALLALAAATICWLHLRDVRSDLEDLRKFLGDDGPTGGGVNVGGGGGPPPVK